MHGGAESSGEVTVSRGMNLRMRTRSSIRIPKLQKAILRRWAPESANPTCTGIDVRHALN